MRVTEEEKAKFRRFMDETDEFDTLSRFLRVTALRYINTKDEPATVDTQEIESAFEQTISALYDRLDQLENHLSQLIRGQQIVIKSTSWLKRSTTTPHAANRLIIHSFNQKGAVILLNRI